MSVVACTAPEQEDTEDATGAATTGASELPPVPKNLGPVAYVLLAFQNKEVHCAATLVRPDVLVTSASCVDPVVFAPNVKVSDVVTFVFFGKDPAEVAFEKSVVEGRNIWRVRKTVLHPRWESLSPGERRAAPGSSGEADRVNVAVLVLKEPAPNAVTPIDIDWDASTRLRGSPRLESAGFGGTTDPKAPVLPRRSMPVTRLDPFDIPGAVTYARSMVGSGAADQGGPLLYGTASTPRILGVRVRDTRIGATPVATFTLFESNRDFLEREFKASRR
jgi:hypothetical protein